jgi:hypothetical protein
MTTRDVAIGPSRVFPGRVLGVDAFAGICSAQLIPLEAAPVNFWTTWHHYDQRATAWEREVIHKFVREDGLFGMTESDDSGKGIRFPLWYPALIFTLAGVGVLRLRRQFSIRSAIIAVSVVAVLLGIILAL